MRQTGVGIANAAEALRNGLAVACIALAEVPCSAMGVECPDVVRVVYTDVAIPPYYNGQGADIPSDPGLAVEWVREAIAKSNCKPRVLFSRLPIPRLILAINDATQDIAAVLLYTPERAKTFQFPMRFGRLDDTLLLFHSNLSLYALSATQVVWDQRKVLPADLVVGVVRGQIASFVAKEQGWSYDEAPDSATNFRKLLRGQIPLVLEQSFLADVERQKVPEGSFRELAPPVRSEAVYSATSQLFFKRYPEFTREYWHNICHEARTHFKDPTPCGP
jgi:hypothetical protein